MMAKFLAVEIKRRMPKAILGVLYYFRNYFDSIPNVDNYLSYAVGRKGVEIGGPSVLFKTALPVYKKIKSLDCVNFSGQTLWEGGIKAGLNFQFIGQRIGYQFLSEATDLADIADGSYDLVLSSNCLEHIANPIKALLEWRRVLMKGGVLILVLPNKAVNFDHNRPITSLDHLVEDFRKNTSERDLTHLSEILNLHDLSKDPMAGDLESFRKRSLDNYNNRTLHHHVFDQGVIKAMLQYAGFDVIHSDETRRDFFSLSIKRG